MNWRATLAAVCVTLGLASSVSAATLTISSDGLLLGAQRVDVNGKFYDVTFGPGSCGSTHSGCDDGWSDFTFITANHANHAANALLNQVFTDTPLGNFNSDPSRIFGCGAGSACDVYIPFQLIGYTVQVVMIQNLASGSDQVWFTTNDQWSSVSPGGTWARWSLSPPEPPAVPEPATLTLLGLGLIGATASRRLRKKA